MKLQHLAIATISWARDKAEEQLLRMALKQLSTLGIPVFITDGGSPQDFVDYMRGLPHFTVLESTEKGLWPQMKLSLQNAYNAGTPFIFYTEPDKLEFFKLVIKMLDETEVNEDAGVILASRTAAGMATYPAFQQMTETAINNCCAEVTGHDLDFTYGPFILNRNVIPHLQALPDEIGWGWRLYAFKIAAQMNLQITAKESNYSCPENQQKNDKNERIYRMKQMIQSIEGLVLSSAKDILQ